MVRVRLLLWRLDITADLLFIVDTGADRSVLGAGDGRLIGLDYGTLDDDTQAYGIGGVTKVFREPAVISMQHNGSLHVFDTAIDIMPREAIHSGIPSLLGRDVLNRVRLVVDACHSEAELTPHYPDQVFPIGDLDSP